MYRRLAVSVLSTALVAAMLSTGASSAQADEVPDWGPNLLVNGDFETDPEVGAPPPDWQLVGRQSTSPASVVAVGDDEHALHIGSRDGTGTDIRGLSWELADPADHVKVEFAFAVPETGGPRSLEFWTRGEGQTDAVSQVTVAYQNDKLEQAGPYGASSRHLIGEQLTTSDAESGDYTWYRLRAVVESYSDTVDFWLSGPDQPLPAESEPPTVTTSTWITNMPVRSVNFGFAHVYDDAYYLVDDVDVRTAPRTGAGPVPLDPIEGGPELLINTDFAYDGIGQTPVGWAEWPADRTVSDLGVSETGVGAADRTLRIRGNEASSKVYGVGQRFGEPQEKVQLEFSFAFTEAANTFNVWTIGADDRSNVTQVNLRIRGTTLQQHDGSAWRDLTSLTPSVDSDQDGELVEGTDDLFWHKIRIIAGRSNDRLAIWLAAEGEAFAAEPDFEPAVYLTHTSIDGLVFGYTKVSVGEVYHVGQLTATGQPDPEPTPDNNIERYHLWDGFFGSTGGHLAPEPEGMTRTLIHTPEGQWPPVAGQTSDDCTFLHGVAIHEHEGTLYASWENGPRDENSPAAMMRGARSTDWGQTWSQVEVVAPNPDFEGTDPEQVDPCSDPAPGTVTGQGRSHGAYVSWQGQVYVYVAAYDFDGEQGRFRKDLHAELWTLEEATDSWVQVKENVIDNLWPIEPPKQMDNGRWIMASIDRDYKAAYAISDTDDPTGEWTTTTLPNVEIPTGSSTRARYTEATTWVDGPEVTLVMRTQATGQNVRVAGVARSHDYAQTWEILGTHPHYLPGDRWGEPSEVRSVPMIESNVPMTAANPFVGELSTGQRYLISNIYNRHALSIQLSRIGETRLSQTFLIHEDPPAVLYPGRSKGRQYNQPYAIEVTRDGQQYLYVVYSVNKEAAELAIIPVASLAGEPAALASVELAEGVHLRPGQSADLEPVASRVDGTVLDWTLARSRSFHSDHPDLVTFTAEGIMTISPAASGVGQIKVWVSADYGLGPVSSSPTLVSIDWDPSYTYDAGDLVMHHGALYEAQWWTRAEPGTSVWGSWQEIATTADGTALWTPSRAFRQGDVVRYQEKTYVARWWTRNQVPGTQYGPWEELQRS